MEIRQLEYASAVGRYRNFTKAAAALHISQPTISVAISRLEEELGLKLFLREGKKVAPTPEGEVFLASAEQILLETHRLERVMGDLRFTKKETLRVSFPSTSGSWLWPELLFRFPTIYPKVELDIEDYGTMEMIQLLREEKLDVGYGIFGLLDGSEQDIAREVIRRGELKMIMPAIHPFAKLPQLTLSMLADELIIMYQRGSTYTEKLLMGEMNKNHLHPQVKYVRQQSSVFDMVSQGCGVAAVLNDQISAIRDNPRIVSRSLDRRLTYEAGLLWKKGRKLTRGAKQFIDFIREYRN